MSDWKKIEALLFASGRYLSEEQISEMTQIPKNKVKKALSELVKHYEEIDSALKTFEEDGYWKMNPKEEFSEIVQRVVSEAELPKPVMETLAVIAYKNPILQSELKDIRGSGIYDHVQLLEDKGYVVKERFGRTYKLKLTEKFFEYFDVDGEKDIRALFKDVKKPDVKQIGDLEVYDTKTSDLEFSEKIIERMKKLETSESEEKEHDDFLNKFEEKLVLKKSSIDEAEKEIDELKPKVEVVDEEAPLAEGGELNAEVGMKGGKESINEEVEDNEEDTNNEDADTEQDLDDEETPEDEEAIDEDQDVEDEKEDSEIEDEKVPEQDKKKFLKKINHDIAEITGDDEDEEDSDDKK